MPAHTPAPRKLPEAFETLPTPDPQQFSFRVRMDSTVFNPTTAVAAGTPYKECSFIPTRGRLGLQGFDDYVYTYCERDGSFLWFYFGKRRTGLNRGLPFRSFYTNQNYPWPAVLEDLYFVRSTFPQSAWDGTTTQTTDTILPRFRYRPGVNVDSLCLVEQFLDAIPWTDAEMTHDQPVPTDVDASYIGTTVNFPRCLHGDIIINEASPGAQIIQGAGMQNPPPGRNPDRMFFPRTNYTDWAPFVLEDRQQPTQGLWLREKVTIYPPVQPGTSSR